MKFSFWQEIFRHVHFITHDLDIKPGCLKILPTHRQTMMNNCANWDLFLSFHKGTSIQDTIWPLTSKCNLNLKHRLRFLWPTNHWCWLVIVQSYFRIVQGTLKLWTDTKYGQTKQPTNGSSSLCLQLLWHCGRNINILVENRLSLSYHQKVHLSTMTKYSGIMVTTFGAFTFYELFEQLFNS